MRGRVGNSDFERSYRGNVATYTDQATKTTIYQYDDLNRLVKEIDPLTGETSYGYDAQGNLTSMTDANSRTTLYAYDELDRLTSVTAPDTTVTSYGYDAVGNLKSVEDPNQNTTTYDYDDLHRLVLETDELLHTRTYQYDLVGNLTELTDKNGRTRTFDYDFIDRLEAEHWLDGANVIRTISYGYDAAGNLLTASDPDSTYTLTYDALHRVETVDNLGTGGLPNIVLTYSYDFAGNLTNVLDNQGINVGLAYDARDLLVVQSWQGTGIDPVRVEFDYDNRGLMSETHRYSDLEGTVQVSHSTYTYDDAWQLTDLTHSGPVSGGSPVVADYDYTFDLAGDLKSQTINGQSTIYTYDPNGQLTSADHSVLTDESYDYDTNGNRTTGTTIGPNNQIQSDGVYNYTYDGEGNLITKTEIATSEYVEYEYDYRNRMTRAEVRSSGGILLSEVVFVYDVFDRRIAKTVDSDGAGPLAAETLFTVYDGHNAWADFDAAGNVVARYLFGNAIDELLARWRPTEGTAWYLTDHLGSVRDILDSAGAVIDHIEYDSFGNILSETNAAAGDRFKFTGREWDPELALYYYRARFYDPSLGRFISQDPIGFAAGDANLYRYVGNSPLMYVDPLGLTVTSEKSSILKRGVIGTILSAPFTTCFIITSIANVGISYTFDSAFYPRFGPPSVPEKIRDTIFDVGTAAISCFLFPPANVANATFGAVAVSLEKSVQIGIIAGLIPDVVTLTLRHVTAISWATALGGGDSSQSGDAGGQSSGKTEETTPSSGKWNRPNVQDPVLEDAMDNLWRPQDQRPGGTIAELLREIESGGELIHLEKAKARLTQLIRRVNDFSIPLSKADRSAAERVINDLKEVIRIAEGL